MALEVKELVVKFNVEEGKAIGGDVLSSYNKRDIDRMEASIIEKCVEKVISVIDNKFDR